MYIFRKAATPKNPNITNFVMQEATVQVQYRYLTVPPLLGVSDNLGGVNRAFLALLELPPVAALQKYQETDGERKQGVNNNNIRKKYG